MPEVKTASDQDRLTQLTRKLERADLSDQERQEYETLVRRLTGH